MALRGENASAKSLHSVVQSLESDKVKLELKVKNLELQLKENRRQLSSSSGRTLPERHSCPPPTHTHWRCSLQRGPFWPGLKAANTLPRPALPSRALPPLPRPGLGTRHRGAPGTPLWACSWSGLWAETRQQRRLPPQCGWGSRGAPVRESRGGPAPLNQGGEDSCPCAAENPPPKRENPRGAQGSAGRAPQGSGWGTGAHNPTENECLALVHSLRQQERDCRFSKPRPPPPFSCVLIQGNADTQAEEDERAQESQVRRPLSLRLLAVFKNSFNLLNR